MGDNLFERRALLGAAGLVGAAALVKASKAGPIDPPGGPVAPSGHTIDEVYNKVQTLPGVGAGDGRIAIPGGTSSVFINAGGSYVLTGNIALGPGAGGGGSNPAVAITNSHVTLDLNGYTISGPASLASVLSIIPGPPGVPSNITVRNGSIVGGNAGVVIGNSLGVTLENIRIHSPRTYGVISTSTSARGITVRSCAFTDIGGGTAVGDPVVPIIAISLVGNPQSLIEGNTVGRMFTNGSPTSFHAVYITSATAQAVVISGNTVAVNPSIVGQSPTLPGVYFASAVTGVARNNTVIGFPNSYSGFAGGGGGVGGMIDGGGNV